MIFIITGKVYHMKKLYGVIMLFTLSFFFSQPHSFSQTKNRAEVPKEFTWNLADIYPSDEAWTQAKSRCTAELDKLTPFKGTLAQSSTRLLDCMNITYDIKKTLERLASYAQMKSHEDLRNATYLGMTQSMDQIGTDFVSKASFIEPEIIAMDPATIEQFFKQEPTLQVYTFYINDLLRVKKFKLSQKEEKIMAEASLMASAPGSIHQVFSDAELPYPEVKLSDGTTALINAAGYGRYRATPNRADREIVFKNFFETLSKFQNTFATQLSSLVNTHLFIKRTRGYDSCLDAALNADNIPTDVYRALVDNVNENLPTFHRYLALKKRMLGVDTLKYSDLYAPVVKGVNLTYNVDQARAMIQEALQPLGADYVATVTTAMEDRWIDFYPTTGKRSGAYSNGSLYDVHPYMLLNYNGLYTDVSTMAHELGHSMQSYLSNKTQPYPTANYPIFVAEVASTLNEILLINNMLDKIKDDDIKLSLLMNHLDGIKGTVFRQTQFAEFELRMHEKAEQGEPLTGQALSALYGDILKKYYGHAQNICRTDDLFNIEWAYIPHFYYNFYVYQYSTSYTASVALAEKIMQKEKGAAEKYLAFLSSGGSDYPINLLKTAGVDMRTKEPFDKTMMAMNRIMDEIEKILAKKK
jgi:oligoendopeptidase F